MANEIVAEITLDLDTFRKLLKEGEKDAKESGEKGGKSFGDGVEDGMGKALGSLKAQFLALAGALAGAFTLKEAIKQAGEQQAAINSLNMAMAQSGTYTAAASQHFQDFAASLQKTTTVADDVIIKSGALLVTLGKLSGDGLDRATKAALDMAAGLAGQGMTVESAFNIVAKAASGHVSVLNRYGIKLQETGDKTYDFNKALGELEKRFQGMAALQSNTFEGAMEQTKNSFADVLKEIGKIIVESPTMIALIKVVGEAFKTAAEQLSEWGEGGDRIKELGGMFVSLGQIITQYVIAPLELAFNGIKAGTAAVATGIAAIGEALGLVDPKTVTALAEETSASAEKIFDFSSTAAADKFLTNAQEFFDQVSPPVQANFAKISENAKAALGTPGFLQNFAESFTDGIMKMNAATKDFGANIYRVMAVGVANSFAALGSALVKGENGMEAFGKAMLGVLGDIAIQFGTTFMAMGVAKTLLFDPTGPLLIAAGAGLALLGGVLKGIGGGGGGASAPSAGGGVGAGGGTGAPAQIDVGQMQVEKQDRAEIGNRVNVNIEGNVFDRRETGLQIADAINEAFGSNGVTFATSNA